MGLVVCGGGVGLWGGGVSPIADDVLGSNGHGGQSEHTTVVVTMVAVVSRCS